MSQWSTECFRTYKSIVTLQALCISNLKPTATCLNSYNLPVWYRISSFAFIPFLYVYLLRDRCGGWGHHAKAMRECWPLTLPSYLRLFLESVCSILQSMRDSRPFISRIDLPLSLITLLVLDLAVNGTLGLGNAERDGGSCRVNIQLLYYYKQTMYGQRSHTVLHLE